jgi:hypothetical protein
MTSDQIDADLHERLTQLETENRALRTQLDGYPSVVEDARASIPRSRGSGWTVLAAVLIVLGCLLAPVAVISGWAKSTLTDTDAFVATYAPLAHNAGVQSFVVDQAAAAINQNINVEQLTSDVIDGIKALGTRPRASVALDTLKGPATQGIETLVRNGITDFVASDAFADTWDRALRLSHTQLLATLSNDPQALVAAQSDGTIGVQLGPIIDDVKAALLARGLSVAARIPAVDRTIPIAQATQISTIQAGYRSVIALGGWLPWVALIVVAAGVLVARRRGVALVWAAVGLALSMLVLAIGLTIGRAVLLTAVPPALVPGDVTTLLYDTATTAMKDTAVIGLVLAAAIAVVGWFAGPFQTPRKLRGFYTDGIASARNNAERRGVTTGGFGDWVYQQRRVLHLILALAASAAIILLRPLSVSDILWTLTIAVLGLLIMSLVERPQRVDAVQPAPAAA